MKSSKSVVMKHKKVSKTTSRRVKPESISIHLKRPIAKSIAHVTPSDNNNNNIKSLAKQLKQRLSAAAATVTTSLMPNNNSNNNNNLPEPDVDVVVEPTLSNSDWPTKTPVLRNLKLLKQYLLFVSQEDQTTVQLNSKDHSIQFDFSGDTKYVTNESVARTGATLVESLVHSSNNALDHHSSHEGSRRLNRRKPGRPPKTTKVDDDKLEHQSRIRVRKPYRATPYTVPIPKKKNKNIVQCICNSPQEEFGTMVQCDDCLHWLHSDCLELSDQALKQSFRCPSCLTVSEHDEVESALSWRHLAQWKSQRLADTQSDMTSDEEDDADYIPFPYNKPRLQTKSQLSQNASYFLYEDDDDDATDDNDTTESSSAPLTPSDQVDFFPFDDHPSEDSVSEANTPERQSYYETLQDHFFNEIDTILWNQDTLNALVHLAREHSQRYALEHVFPQSENTPFNPENLVRDESLFSGPTQLLPSVDDLPSDLCPEFTEDFISFCGYMP